MGEGLIIAADSIAREFSDWGSAAAEGSPAAEVRGLDNNGAQESRDCLSSLGDGARERLGNGDAARGVLRLAAVIPVPLTALAHVPVTAAPGEREVRFVREFFEQGKPVGAICHGIWMLVEADVVDGRTLTSWPSLKTDVANAGGTWVDKEVVVDRGLVTSRKPDDLPAFCRKLVEEISEGVHAEQAEAVRS